MQAGSGSTERRIGMFPKIVAFAILGLVLLPFAQPASAMTVTLTSGSVSRNSGPSGGITCTGAGPDALTRKLTLSCNEVTAANMNGFRVSAQTGTTWQVTAETSGSVLLFKLVNTLITRASTTAATLTISAVSGTTSVSGVAVADFLPISPVLTKAGGKLNANLTVPVGTALTAGNRISLEASLATNTTNVINTPTQGPTGITLPINFTGNPNGFFEAQAGKLSTSATGAVSITDSIAVTCLTAPCTPTLRLTVNATLTCNGCAWNLPNGAGQAADVTPGGGNTQTVSETLAPSFDKFEAWMQVVKPSKFAFESLMTLGGVQPLDPANKVLHLDWAPASSDASPFSATIPPKTFKPITSRIWKATFRDGTTDLVAIITQFDQAGRKFGLLLTGTGAAVGNIGKLGTAQLAIGDQTGKDLIKPTFVGDR
jgi:hypothetical protein